MPKPRGSADALRVSLLDRRVSNSQRSEIQRLPPRETLVGVTLESIPPAYERPAQRDGCGDDLGDAV